MDKKVSSTALKIGEILGFSAINMTGVTHIANDFLGGLVKNVKAWEESRDQVLTVWTKFLFLSFQLLLNIPAFPVFSAFLTPDEKKSELKKNEIR